MKINNNQKNGQAAVLGVRGISFNSVEECDMVKNAKVYGLEESIKASKYPMSVDVHSLNEEITNTVKSLGSSKMGEGHDNYLNGIVVQFDLTLTNKVWTEMQRYHFIDFVSSQSTIHRMAKFDLDEQYIEYVDPRIVEIIKEKQNKYNQALEDKVDNDYLKYLYKELLYSNPCGFKLTARMTTNYRQLKTIYNQRKNHKLDEWVEFCKWIERLPNFKELCLGGE